MEIEGLGTSICFFFGGGFKDVLLCQKPPFLFDLRPGDDISCGVFYFLVFFFDVFVWFYHIPAVALLMSFLYLQPSD